MLNDIMNDTSGQALFPMRCRILQRVQVERPHPRQQVHLRSLDEETALVSGEKLPEDEKRDHDDCGEVFFKESLCATGGGAANRLGTQQSALDLGRAMRGCDTYEEGYIEGGDQGDPVEGEAEVASYHTELRLERQFIQAVTLRLPAGTEANVSEVDAAPDEEIRETGKGEQPGEESRTRRRLVDESEKPEEQLDDNAPNGATLLVNVCQEPGPHTPCRQSLHGTCGAESAGVGNTEHRQSDDCVEDGRKPFDASPFDGQHKWRSLCIITTRTKQIRIVGR